MTQRIRCKMICHNVWPHEHQEGMSMVSFGAVWSPDTGKPDDENAIYGKLTPFGTHSSAWHNAAAEQLEVGKAYYVDFTRAD